MDINNSKDVKRSKSEEAGIAPSSRVPTKNENPAEQNELNHMDEQVEPISLDHGKEYVARLHAATEEIISKPRSGTHVSELTLCHRLRVFSAIDPLPISAKALNMFITGMAIHSVAQFLFLHDPRRFEREKHLEFRGITGSVDIFDKIRHIPLEFKTTRALNITDPKPWHVQQLKWYMAMLGASEGYIMYQKLMHFGNAPFKTFQILMTAQERKEQLEKLVDEADSLRTAMEARDPSLAKPVYDDPKLNWLCRECPYQVNCKRMQDAAAAA